MEMILVLLDRKHWSSFGCRAIYSFRCVS